MIPAQALVKWAKAFLGGKSVDEYNQPVLANSEWWKGVGECVDEFYIVAGSDEVLLDSKSLFGLISHSPLSSIIFESLCSFELVGVLIQLTEQDYFVGGAFTIPEEVK